MNDFIKNPQKSKSLKKITLDKAQIEKLLASIDRSNIYGSRDYALINLIVHTGLRITEIINTTKGDIVDCCGLVVLWTQQNNKNYKDKNVKLTNKIYSPIYEYLKIINSENDTDPLFSSHSKKNFGQPLTARSISRIVKNRLNNIGINNKYVNTYSLRNSK
jgi:integrase/recombinase XerD